MSSTPHSLLERLLTIIPHSKLDELVTTHCGDERPWKRERKQLEITLISYGTPALRQELADYISSTLKGTSAS